MSKAWKLVERCILTSLIDLEGVLIWPTSSGPPGGPQSTPEALRGKKFCFWKGGPNDSECFDLPRSTIVKNTFLKKEIVKFFILVDFDVKMVNISDLECSADANSGMRQVKFFFLHVLIPLMTIRRCAYWTNLYGTLRGALKYPQGLTLKKRPS